MSRVYEQHQARAYALLPLTELCEGNDIFCNAFHVYKSWL